jgi:hypothetical protein
MARVSSVASENLRSICGWTLLPRWFCLGFSSTWDRSFISAYLVRQAASARKQSFAAANPLALGVGGVGPRSTGLQTPLGWLTGKLTGVGAR